MCQLGRAHSLREIGGGLASVEGKLRHLGLRDAPKRSTRADANRHRPWQLYQTVFGQLLEKCQGVVAQRGGRPFQFKNKLMSLDASVIDLSLSLFDWARFRRTTGAITLHLLLDHDGYLPSFAVIPEGRTSDAYFFRLVEVWNPAKQEAIVFLTNHLEFGATTIAAIYKDRWQVELFFKALKQNLKIKTFLSTACVATGDLVLRTPSGEPYPQ